MEDSGLTKYHYFTAVNVKGSIFIVDAFGEKFVTDNLGDYIDNLKATSYRLVSGEFIAKKVITK